MMPSQVPRVRLTKSSTLIGQNGDAGYLDEWDHRALLLSEPHRRLKGRWSGGGPLFVCRQTTTHGPGLTIPVKVGFGPGAWFVERTVHAKGVASIPTHMPDTISLYNNAVTIQNGELARLTPHYVDGVLRTRPGEPIADAFPFLFELTEGVPIPGSTFFLNRKNWGGFVGNIVKNPVEAIRQYIDFMRSLGGEYLQAQFGWKPFIGDLRRMYKYMLTVNENIRKLREENGKPIHRKATLESSSTNDQTVTVYPYPYANVLGAPPGYMSGSTVFTSTRRTRTKVWFSAEWRYYCPDIESWQWEARARLALFGAIPTPKQLWNVLPFSWMFDWWTNAGKVYSNLSANAVDNATMNYSFTMRSFIDETEANAFVKHPGSTGFYNYPAVEHNFRSKSVTETKSRVGGGDPYGLQVSFGDLTDYQASIIAALGLTRAQFRGFRFGR